MDDELQDLAHAASNAADYYARCPGHAGPEAVVDLYRCVANLAGLTAQAIEARRAETGTGSVHESAVGKADAPNPPAPSTPIPTPTPGEER